MKTIKSFAAGRRYTNSELLSFLSANPVCAGEPKLVGRARAEMIIFPDTQDGTYVVSVKCSKKINVYLGEYVPPNPKRAIYDCYYSDITYWGDLHRRKNIYDKIARVADDIKKLLGIED